MAKGPPKFPCPKCGEMISSILKAHKKKANGSPCGWKQPVSECYLKSDIQQSIAELIEIAHGDNSAFGGLKGLKYAFEERYLEKYPKRAVDPVEAIGKMDEGEKLDTIKALIAALTPAQRKALK